MLQFTMQTAIICHLALYHATILHGAVTAVKVEKMSVCENWLFFRFADEWGLTLVSEKGAGGKRIALIC